MSLQKEMKVFGFITTVLQLTLLVLITCTCNGPRLMLGHQIIGNQTDYSLYSGKLAKQTKDVMVCATSKTDGLVSPLWHQERQLIKRQYPATLDLVYYQRLELMQR